MHSIVSFRNSFIFVFLGSIMACTLSKSPQGTKQNETVFNSPLNTEKLKVNSINGKFMMKDTSSIICYFYIKFNAAELESNKQEIEKKFKVQWSIIPESGIKEKLKSGRLVLSDDNFKKNKDHYELQFEVPKVRSNPQGILNLDFIDSELATKYTYDMYVDFQGKRINYRMGLFETRDSDFPIFENFIKQNSKVYVKSYLQNETPFYLLKFKNQSTSALSPMSSSKKDEKSEFLLEEKLTYNFNETIELGSAGTYLLSQNPEEGNDGYGVLVGDTDFPKDLNPETLLPPLYYMSTPKEIDILRSGEDPKKIMDNYFLTLTAGNNQNGKLLVKNYYKRVNNANVLFSSYKEGWKTDKGMVYVIMGPPTKVQRNRNKEVWQYANNQNSSDIIFTFVRKSNKFTNDSYELVRYPEYASFWYPYVELWRKGSVTE